MIREEGEGCNLRGWSSREFIRNLSDCSGRMKFRTSYGQNALKHSIEVAQLSGLLAAEIGGMSELQNVQVYCMISEKSVDRDMEGSHIQIGVDLCRKYKESPIIINAVGSTSW